MSNRPIKHFELKNYIEYTELLVPRLLLSLHFSAELRTCSLRYVAFYLLR